MKKFLLIFLVLLIVFGCKEKTEENDISDEVIENFISDEDNESIKVNKCLIVYFSESDDIEIIADTIMEKYEASEFALIPAQTYTEKELDKTNEKSRIVIEQNDDTCRPKIANQLTIVDQYDVIFLGYPSWCKKIPKIIYTFLESYNLDDKIIITFTNNEDVFEEEIKLKELYTKMTWIVNNTVDQENVVTWLNSLDIKKEQD